jgi:predicted O-methyltransferase YrrM
MPRKERPSSSTFYSFRRADYRFWENTGSFRPGISIAVPTNVNQVLHRIVTTQRVTDGATTLPLSHPDFPQLPVAVDEREGKFLQQIVGDLQPHVSVEIGCAYGVSTLYICEALSALPHPARHIVIDPFQQSQWRGIGRKNVEDAGFGHIADFREDYAELALPRLLEEHVTVDFAFVDGRHTFDQVMVEFYYVNKMLRVGGVIAFDDADRRSVNRVIRHALRYPAYRAYASSSPTPARKTIFGHVRRAVASIPMAASVVREDVIHRDWDLNIFGSCVAIQKIGEDGRSSGWDAPF